GLPVVRVNDLRMPADGTSRRSDQRRSTREHAEAQRVVFPVCAARVLIRAALPIIERRTIDDPCRNAPRQFRLEETCRGKPCEGIDSRYVARAGQRCEHRRVPGEDDARVEPDLPLREGKRSRDVAETAGLDE